MFKSLTIPHLPATSPTAPQPPLLLPLYPHQLRNIHRMKLIETDPSLGKRFHLPPHHLIYHGRGGVLADPVGLGKTATVFGLIASEPLDPSGGANLIVTPSHLFPQWRSEVRKFAATSEIRLVCGYEALLRAMHGGRAPPQRMADGAPATAADATALAQTASEGVWARIARLRGGNARATGVHTAQTTHDPWKVDARTVAAAAEAFAQKNAASQGSAELPLFSNRTIVLIDVEDVINARRVMYAGFPTRKLFRSIEGSSGIDANGRMIGVPLEVNHAQLERYKRAAIFVSKGFKGVLYDSLLHMPPVPWRRVMMDEIHDLILDGTAIQDNLIQLTREARNVWLVSATPFAKGKDSVYGAHQLLGFRRLRLPAYHLESTTALHRDNAFEVIKRRLYITNPASVRQRCIGDTVSVVHRTIEVRHSATEVATYNADEALRQYGLGPRAQVWHPSLHDVRKLCCHPAASEELRALLARGEREHGARGGPANAAAAAFGGSGRRLATMPSQVVDGLRAKEADLTAQIRNARREHDAAVCGRAIAGELLRRARAHNRAQALGAQVAAASAQALPIASLTVVKSDVDELCRGALAEHALVQDGVLGTALLARQGREGDEVVAHRRNFDRGERYGGNGRYIVFGARLVLEFCALRLSTEAEQAAFRKASDDTALRLRGKALTMAAERSKLKQRRLFLSRVVEELVKVRKSGKVPECPLCLESLPDLALAPCGHIVCDGCADKLLTNAALPPNPSDAAPCPSCRKPIRAEHFVRFNVGDALHRGGSAEGGDGEVERREGESEELYDARRQIMQAHSVDKARYGAKPAALIKYIRLATAKNALRDEAAAYPSSSSSPSSSSAAVSSASSSGSSQALPSKVIIFSMWGDVLDIVAETLKRAGIRSVFCKGDARQKQRAVASFIGAASSSSSSSSSASSSSAVTSSVDVMMMSAQSMAGGLNLQIANHVVLLDPPGASAGHGAALEEQAIGRCARLGQTREVTVVRFQVYRTIEKDLYADVAEAQQQRSDTARAEEHLAQNVCEGAMLQLQPQVAAPRAASVRHTAEEEEEGFRLVATQSLTAGEAVAKRVAEAAAAGLVFDLTDDGVFALNPRAQIPLDKHAKQRFKERSAAMGRAARSARSNGSGCGSSVGVGGKVKDERIAAAPVTRPAVAPAVSAAAPAPVAAPSPAAGRDVNRVPLNAVPHMLSKSCCRKIVKARRVRGRPFATLTEAVDECLGGAYADPSARAAKVSKMKRAGYHCGAVVSTSHRGAPSAAAAATASTAAAATAPKSVGGLAVPAAFTAAAAASSSTFTVAEVASGATLDANGAPILVLRDDMSVEQRMNARQAYSDCVRKRARVAKATKKAKRIAAAAARRKRGTTTTSVDEAARVRAAPKKRNAAAATAAAAAAATAAERRSAERKTVAPGHSAIPMPAPAPVAAPAPAPAPAPAREVPSTPETEPEPDMNDVDATIAPRPLPRPALEDLAVLPSHQANTKAMPAKKKAATTKKAKKKPTAAEKRVAAARAVAAAALRAAANRRRAPPKSDAAPRALKRARRSGRSALSASATASHLTSFITVGAPLSVEYDGKKFDAIAVSVAATRVKVCYVLDGSFEFIAWSEVAARVAPRVVLDDDAESSATKTKTKSNVRCVVDGKTVAFASATKLVKVTGGAAGAGATPRVAASTPSASS